MNGMKSAGLAVLLGTALAMPAKAETWDMALAYAATNFHSEIAAEFAAEVTEKTGGELEIVTHPSGSLFAGDEIFGAVRRGLIPIGERLISALGNEDALYEIDSVPFLATSFEEARELYDVSKPALEAKLEDAGVLLLYSVPWPPQGLYTTTAAETPADLEGLKFRAYNATTSAIAEMLGMVPTTIEAAELSQAFATGVADSMISSGATGYDRQLWEHVDYFYDVRAWLPRNMVIVNQRAWSGLDQETQDIIREAAANAEEKGWAKSEELAGWYLEELAAEGMNVEAEASPEMQAAFEEIGAKLKEDWLARADEEGQEVLNAYESD